MDRTKAEGEYEVYKEKELCRKKSMKIRRKKVKEGKEKERQSQEVRLDKDMWTDETEIIN